MAHTIVVEPGRVQSWIRKTIKQQIQSCTWDKLSNRFSYNMPLPLASEMTMPKTVVTKVTDEMREGEYRTTMLSIRKPNATAIEGPNPAEGREYKSSTKAVSVYYNVQRFPMAISDRSVGGNLGKFYRAAERNRSMIADLFVEQTDYDHSKAMIDGANLGLTDTSAWQDSEYGSEIDAPMIPVLHPNIYCWTNGAAVKNTWSTTYGTATANLEALMDDMDTADIFNLSALDTISLIAHRKIAAVGGFQGSGEVKFVLLISDSQAHQLMTDASANQVKDLFKYSEKGFDKVFQGYLGVYKGMMVIASQRQPLAAIAANNTTFQYITPNGDARSPVALNDSAGTGTGEIAMLLGLNAIGVAEPEEMDFDNKDFDYNWSKGLCGTRSRGTVRLDLDTNTSSTPTSGRINETSFLFITATTASVITN